MKKLILILLAFIALFTFIRAFEEAEAQETNITETSVSVQN